MPQAKFRNDTDSTFEAEYGITSYGRTSCQTRNLDRPGEART